MPRLPIIALLLLSSALSSHAQEKRVPLNGTNYTVYTKGLDKRKKTTPALIFENGLGVGLGNWSTIIDELSKHAPVFAYNRAGVETSDRLLKMPTPKLVADNLKALLTTLNIQPPYILIGHSLGGMYIRAFAGYYPNDVAALVFIDPADFTETKQEWNSIFRTLGLPEKKIDEMLYDRLYKKTEIDSANFGPSTEAQVLAELRRTDFAEINRLPLPNVPIVFFASGKFEVPPDRWSKDFNQQEFFKVRTRLNIDRWRALIDTSPQNSALIYLPQAGHFIHRDTPTPVITQIKSLLDIP